MTSTRRARAGIQMSSANSKAVIIGFTLGAAGGLISICGLGLGGTAMVIAILRWLKAQPEPPAVTVRRKVGQASAAAAAASSAWQNQDAAQSRRR